MDLASHLCWWASSSPRSLDECFLVPSYSTCADWRELLQQKHLLLLRLSSKSALVKYSTMESTTPAMKHNPGIIHSEGWIFIITSGTKSPKPTVVRVMNHTYTPCLMLQPLVACDAAAAENTMDVSTKMLPNRTFSSRFLLSFCFLQRQFSNFVISHLTLLLYPSPMDLRVRIVRGIPKMAYTIVIICPAAVLGVMFP